MTAEMAFIDLLRQFADDPAARGLADDCAVIPFGSENLVLTHDAMLPDVHFFADADPADVAWKLLVVNLSDLAAKGAEPIGVMLGYTLSDADWDTAFAAGLRAALAHYDVPLLGGDTVSPSGERTGKRSFGMTAIGRATTASVPSRAGAGAGDILYVTGPVGAAYAGYRLVKDGGQDNAADAAALFHAFHRPTALLGEGVDLAPQASAMMDISDGLLLDAARMAQASEVALSIEFDAIPFNIAAAKRHFPQSELRGNAAHVQNAECAKLAEYALTFGDDYQLLFALPSHVQPPVQSWPIGKFVIGSGMELTLGSKSWPLPKTLGFQHH